MSELAPTTHCGGEHIQLLPKKWIDFLVKEDEAGMNYHIVDMTMKDGTTVHSVLVANCQYISERRPEWRSIRVSDIVSMRTKIPKRPLTAGTSSHTVY